MHRRDRRGEGEGIVCIGEIGEGRGGGGYCVHRRDRRGEGRGRVLCA